MSNNPPVDVQQYGQSIWYDNISRGFLKSGEIQRLVDEDGVMGITSNPTIFMKAMGAKRDYDEAIESLLDLEPYEIYEALAVEDIRAAAEILRPIYERTDKIDGYISLEVSPLLANDTESTLSEARRLFKAVDRPNVMIKIPATEAGLPAIEEAIFDGININITLIFSVENYRQVAQRYINGLQRRLEAGLPVTGIASVASFFVSRIDTMVDRHLENNARSAQGRNLPLVRMNLDLLGKVAIANAKMAYRAYQEIFEGDGFKALREAGAQVQRPLWASTGTKNPKYPDTLYIDTLIGPNTVNTVPPETLRAFKHHGTVAPTLEQDMGEAIDFLDKLAEVGIDLANINKMLQTDGVDSFVDSFDQLIKAVEGKREMLRAGVIQRQSGIVGGYEPGARRMVERLDQRKVNPAIWNRDASIWKENIAHQESIRNRLGWLTSLTDGRIDRQLLAQLKEDSRQWSHAVLLGMGGSSLAPEVLATTFGRQAGFPEFLVLDSTDPARIKAVESAVTLESTLFIVASKSGTTLETECFRRYFYDKVMEKVGAEKAGAQFIAITDPESYLADLAERDGYRYTLINPADIGGRYSALSYFGLAPAAIMGLDLDKFIASAETMIRASAEIIPTQGHPGIWLGALMGYLAERGLNKLGLLFSAPIASFAHWVEQLVAESTGKEEEGIVPVIAATIGRPHDYDDDRFLVYLRLDGESEETDAQVRALWEAGQPVFTIRLRDPYDLGGEFFRWEYATAVAGHILKINPFDEPNVTESKNNTNRLLEYYKQNGTLPQDDPYLVEDDVALYVDADTGEMLSKICAQRNYTDTNLAGMLAAHIGFARSERYIALMAYLEPNEVHDKLLNDVRRRLRHLTTRAITLGYGPRYLHSTGQLHKGGPATGVFLQITVDDSEDLSIPEMPYGFSILKQAQAMGDQQALVSRELPFVRLHIKGDVAKGLAKIIQAVEIAEAKLQA